MQRNQPGPGSGLMVGGALGSMYRGGLLACLESLAVTAAAESLVLNGVQIAFGILVSHQFRHHAAGLDVRRLADDFRDIQVHPVMVFLDSGIGLLARVAYFYTAAW